MDVQTLRKNCNQGWKFHSFGIVMQSDCTLYYIKKVVLFIIGLDVYEAMCILTPTSNWAQQHLKILNTQKQLNFNDLDTLN